MFNPNPMLLADFYKLSHRAQYPEGTEFVYSTWTPRKIRISNTSRIVAFGFQMFIKKYLIDYFNEYFFKRDKKEIVDNYKYVVSNTLGIKNPDTRHIEELHDLGFLPLKVCALREGTEVEVGTPMMTVINTDKRFFWLTNYIESLASCELWQTMTSATLARNLQKTLVAGSRETDEDLHHINFQAHDFSFRGMAGLGSAINSGLGHLLYFAGTDSIPAIQAAEYYYNADLTKTLVGTSIPATEHSVQCAYGDDLEYMRRMVTEIHPAGFVSIVADGYDYWNVIENVLPELRKDILNREGTVVIRPDSGNPYNILYGMPGATSRVIRKGTVEALWDIFGGTVNSKGFKVLDPHIRVIYGEAMTAETIEHILNQLMYKQFAASNVVFGIGSYTYQYQTRDSLGFALKSTWVQIKGEPKAIYKAPKTDTSKKSQKGLVAVVAKSGELIYTDSFLTEESLPANNLLLPVFENGKLLIDYNWSDIVKRIE